MISVNLDNLVTEQIKDVLFLKEHGTKTDLEPLIFPYLIADNEKLCVETEQFPDIPIITWNGFKMTYILNWNVRFTTITTWDPLTIYKMGELGIEAAEVFPIAYRNLQKMKIVFNERKVSNITYYAFQFDKHFVNPSFCNSMLLMNDIWKKTAAKFHFTDYYVFPVYRDYIFIADKNEIVKKGYSVQAFRDILKIKEDYYTIPFTDRIFEYTSTNMKNPATYSHNFNYEQLQQKNISAIPYLNEVNYYGY